jgi:hypothetical protein
MGAPTNAKEQAADMSTGLQEQTQTRQEQEEEHNTTHSRAATVRTCVSAPWRIVCVADTLVAVPRRLLRLVAERRRSGGCRRRRRRAAECRWRRNTIERVWSIKGHTVLQLPTVELDGVLPSDRNTSSTTRHPA